MRQPYIMNAHTFLAVVVIVGLGMLFLFNMKFSSHNFRAPSMKRKGMLKNVIQNFNTSPKIVLIFTPLFGVLPWPGVKTNKYFTDRHGKPCPISNCVFTFDKKDLQRSDALIFHARDIPSVKTMKEISSNRNRLRQRWVYYTRENPYFVHHVASDYDYFFNWTMSYRYDSDIFQPYRYYRALTSDEAKDLQRVNHALGKDKLVAWAVNNCGRTRDKIVAKLLKYINITIFGRCGKKFNQRNECKRNSHECDLLLQSFKFYLAFENAMCVDYVTEKYWYTAFEHKMVPIVLGSNYDNHVAIPGSYINVLDFPSLKALASYLVYLDTNDTAYNEYFRWQERYTFDDNFSFECRLCADLHNHSLPVKIYKHLGDFWGRSSCNRNAKEVKRLLKD